MRRSKIYQKIILSYIIIFLIPVAIMRIYIDKVFINEYKKSQLENTFKITQNVARRTEEIFEQINQTIYEITNDDSINRVRYTYNVNNLMQAIKQIHSYCVINPYIKDTVYYYKGIDTFINSDIAFNSRDEHIIKELKINGRNNLIEFLDDIDRLELYKGNHKNIKQKEYYLMSTLYPNVKRSENNIVLAFLDSKEIIEQIEENFFNYNLAMIIRDKETGHEIINMKEEQIPTELVAKIDEYESYNIIKDKGKEYFGTKFNLDIGNIEVYMILELDQILIGITYLNKVIIYILIGVIIIGLILSLLLAEYNYRPVKLLQAYSGEDEMSNQVLKNTDEYLNIRSSIAYLRNKNKDLESNKIKYDEIINGFQVIRKERKGETVNQEQEDKIYKSREFIEENYMEMEFSVGQVCEMFGYAPNAYTQKFKKSFEETPIQYITELRMAKLKELLITTDLPIKVIIEQVGYRDNSTCSKKFAKIVGVSPSQYREKYSIITKKEV
ncbi:MAG: AraC family transcriptional regulator [Clostridium sp.]